MSTVSPFPRHPESPGNEQAGQVDGRICLVEDSKTAGHAVRKLLVKEGYQVDYFTGMEAALAALQSLQYVLLITDLNLRVPGADGDDLIRTLRNANDQAHRLLPILVLTGDAEAQTLVRVFQAGANDYLTKPARPHELRARVENLVRLYRTFQSLTKIPQLPNVAGAVCYVHTNQSHYVNLQRKLGEIGLSVDHFQCADEAFKAVVSNVYDVVIADMKLFRNGMNGDDLTLALRTVENESIRPIPVVLVIEEDDQITLNRVMEVGADDYICNTTRDDEVANKLRRLISQHPKPTIVDPTHNSDHELDQVKVRVQKIPYQEAPTASTTDAPTIVESPEAPSDKSTLSDGFENNTEPSNYADSIQATESVEPRVKIRHINRKPSVESKPAGEQLNQQALRWDSFIHWVLKNPLAFLAACLLVFLITSIGLKNIIFTADYRIFFSEQNPELVAFDSIERTYAKNFGVMFVVTPDNENVFTNDTLKVIQELTEEGWRVPYATRVDSVTNFQHTWSQGDELIVKDLVEEAADLSYDKLLWIKQTAIAEPLLVNRLIAKDGHVTGVNVTVQIPGLSVLESVEIAEYSRGIKRKFEDKYPHIQLHLSGLVMQDYAFYDATIQDIITIIPAMYLFIIVMIAFLFRSIVAMLVITSVIAASSLTAMGIAGWLGIELTAPSSMAPPVILTLAVANGVHILTIFYHLMSEGVSKRDSIRESLRLNLQPVFLTSITTAIGFLSMNFSDSPPFRDLGNIVAIGVLAAFAYSTILLPAMILLLPVKVTKRMGRQYSLMRHLGVYVTQHSGKLMLLVSAVFPILAMGTLLIDVDDNFVEYFDHRYEFRNDADYVQENLTGLANIEFSVGARETGGVNDPFYLQLLEDFSQWLRKQPGVVHVNTITDVMKRLNFNMHGNDPSYYRLPDERDLAAQYLLLYELSLPQGLDLNNQINLDKSASRVTITLDNLSNNEQLALELEASNWLIENTPEFMHTRGASPTIMFANISDRNIRSMFSGTFFALILISGILVFALRSLKIGIISILPNLMPAIMAFGLWGILVGQVGLAISVVSAMALGIIVDDTVHFLSKYLSARRNKGYSASQAVQATFVQVGPALVITSILLVGGFLVLTMSGFSVNADMGLLTAVTIAFALIADLLFLPPLLIWIDQFKHPR